MKRIFFLFVIIFPIINVFGQKNDTIYKIDGSRIIEDIGYHAIKGDNFRYSKKRFQKKSEIPVKEVFKLVIVKNGVHRDGTVESFPTVYKLLNVSKSKNRPRFTEVLVEGYCQLFMVEGLNARDRPVTFYYLLRPEEFAGTIIKRSLVLQKKRSSVLNTYFSECPKVLSHIKSLKRVSGNDIIEIVKMYNIECSK